LHDSAQQNPAAAAAATAAQAAAADVRGALYFIHGSQPLAQNTELASVDLPLDYDIGFTITPAAEEVAGWSNLIHITATGGNCCEHGDRVPGVWFYGNTRRMHIRDGSGKDGNGGCDPEEELPADSPTAVRLEMRVTGTVVFFNDVRRRTCLSSTRVEQNQGLARLLSRVRLARSRVTRVPHQIVRGRSRSAAATPKLAKTRRQRTRRRGSSPRTHGTTRPSRQSATSTSSATATRRRTGCSRPSEGDTSAWRRGRTRLAAATDAILRF
jgi:hypothetical protein